MRIWDVKQKRNDQPLGKHTTKNCRREEIDLSTLPGSGVNRTHVVTEPGTSVKRFFNRKRMQPNLKARRSRDPLHKDTPRSFTHRKSVAVARSGHG